MCRDKGKKKIKISYFNLPDSWKKLTRKAFWSIYLVHYYYYYYVCLCHVVSYVQVMLDPFGLLTLKLYTYHAHQPVSFCCFLIRLLIYILCNINAGCMEQVRDHTTPTIPGNPMYPAPAIFELCPAV